MEKKEWYKTINGILLLILFFYVSIPYLIWTKTKLKKNKKIGLIIAFYIFIFGIMYCE